MKAVIIDDEKRNRDYLRSMLSRHEDLEIVGEANNGIDGLEIITAENPHLIFLDIMMPNMTGLEMLANLGNHSSEVIFVTGYDQFAL